MTSKKITFATVREAALRLPDVEESILHGAPSLKVSGRLLACPALHKSAEPNSLMVKMDLEDRNRLLETQPNIYYVTDHYVNHPAVLVRLEELDRKSLTVLLETAWRFVTSKKQPGRRTVHRKQSG